LSEKGKERREGREMGGRRMNYILKNGLMIEGQELEEGKERRRRRR